MSEGQDWAAADGGRWQAPGSEYWFGTNVLGQDIFERATSGRVAADKQQDLLQRPGSDCPISL